jgi:hypothetical protein
VDCSTRDQLIVEAARTLDKIIELSDKLLDALQAVPPESLVGLDKDLENAMGAKERALGALAQHRNEHGC